ncbi:MAG: nuclear transport factor 2 family protein [Candidatus Binatia bacterium]
MELSTIEAIEQIKQLKARYFRLMDQKRWDEWRDVFTEDVTAVYYNAPSGCQGDGLPELRCNGRADLVAKVREILAKGFSVHHGHMPEIEVTGPTTAKGIWAMFDYLLFPDFTFKGYGHYEEDYVKEDSVWRIKTILLTRLHCEFTRHTSAA